MKLKIIYTASPKAKLLEKFFESFKKKKNRRKLAGKCLLNNRITSS